ncbi:MAG: rRNA maturation RNase YbeY [Prochloraceae cyanobacterium]|nr:rRNA maturation RNase YbeY [Prochloraceae cyanobacterium]
MSQPADRKNLVVEVNLQDVYSSRSNLELQAEYQIPQSLWQQWFTSWLSLLESPIIEGSVCEITLRLTDDREIKNLNSQYRARDRPTDVLAFAALEVDAPKPSSRSFLAEPLYLGDVIISIDTAFSQAKTQNHSLRKEIIWLAAHGFLHLLGWDHPDEESLQLMIRQQETLLRIESLKNYVSETN